MAVAALGALLGFEEVGKSFDRAGHGAVRAIERVSFQLNHGEFVCVIGPSGCGKSTLLRLAAGLDTPTDGRITYQGKDLVGPSRARGVVFQAYNAFPWLTVRQNIGFGLDHLNTAERRETVDRWLREIGLSDFAEAYPRALSGGMRQRLALARTLVVEPTLLLLDEPFGALDEPVRRSMQSTLLNIASAYGCSVLFVTHDIREAILLGDRVLLMGNRPGRILESFDVSVPRPRTADFQDSDACRDIYRRILDKFPASVARTTISGNPA
jgi:ABC-type nitrate/sulfonate/bicarbonate transport system ATPase subunit